MDSFVINHSAFLSPVVNIENGETIGHSSVAIFQKKDLRMAYLVVNTTEDKQDGAPQMLIPFSDVASINKYSISVWVTNLTDSDRRNPLSPETYMQLIEAPVCRKNNIQIGKVSSAVLTLAGDLLSIEVENGEKTKKYSRDQLSRKGSSIVVAEEEEKEPVLKAIPEIQPGTDSTIPEKNNSDVGSLENLIKTVSKQISTLTDYVIDSRRDDNKQNSLREQQSVIRERPFDETEKAVSQKSVEAPIFSVNTPESESLGLSTEGKFAPDDYSKIGSIEKTDTFFTDTCYPEIMKKLDRIEGKIDLLSIKSYPEPNESTDFLEDFSDEKINGLYDIAKKVADNQETDTSAEFDLDADEDVSSDTEDNDTYSLKQPMTEEEKDSIDGVSRIHIENFMEELAMLAKMDSDENDEPIARIEKMETVSKKTAEEPKKEKKQTQKQNPTYWKIAGAQTVSAIVFAAACIAMELFNLF